jgi:alpha-1,3-rhamnosyltransferase
MKKEFSTVSVIIPAHNHEEYIEECLESVRTQDYPQMEMIVINDGSTDGTDRRIRELLRKDPARFTYVSKTNEGLIKTLNQGFAQSRGSYFCELASDDLLLPGSIKKRVDYLEAHPEIDVVFGDAYCIEHGRKTAELLYGEREKYSSDRHTLRDLIEGNVKIFFPSGMFRRPVLERLGGFDEDFRFSEDVAMWYQLALHARIASMNEPVMYYRRHLSNTSSSTPFKVGIRREKILALEKLLPLEIDGMTGFIKRSLYREYKKYIKCSLEYPVDQKYLKEVYRKAVRISPHGMKVRYYMIRSKISALLNPYATKHS